MRKNDTLQSVKSRKTTRVFSEDGAWFYHTREGRRGPFANQNALRADLSAYVGTMEFISDNADEMPADLDSQDVTCVELSAPQF